MKRLQWHITTLASCHEPDLQSLLVNEFCPNSVLHRAAGISTVEYQQALTKSWNSTLCATELSPLVAVNTDTGQVIGGLIPAPFPTDFSALGSLSVKRKKVATLLHALEKQYLKKRPSGQNAILVDIAVVSKAAGGHGIYQQLRRQIQQVAAAAGYTHIVGALSSAITQRVCVDKMQQQVVAEIVYAEYRLNGETPFSSITSTRSIQLVVSALAHEQIR